MQSGFESLSRGNGAALSRYFMKNPILHHYAQQIIPNSLGDVLEMYEKLNCKVIYKPETKIPWALVGQEQLKFAIQVLESESKPIEDLEIKKQAHVGFISDNPRELLNEIKNWADSKNIKFREGGWSEKEFYFDLPDVFINFVVEVMHTSIVED